jgi:ABC-type branched-subunit amino acid transport system substrate-binding protein
MVPVVAFSNSRSVARPNVFVTGLLPGEQVDRIVSYAAGEGHERFAVLAPNNDYGDLIAEAMREAAGRHGVEIADTAFFEPGAQDISAPVRQLADYQRRQQELKRRLAELRSEGTASARREAERLKAQDALGSAPFDAVLLPIGGSRLRQLAPTLPYYDIDPDEVQFLGTTQWYGAPLTGDPSLRGAWFPAPPREGLSRFERRYKETYGAPPRPAPLAALAYDTTALAALLARRAGESDTPPWRVYTQESLTRRTGFAGVTGIFRLNPDGLVQRRYAIMEVTDQGVQTRDPAPGTFTDVPTN